jgi:hypothetical protein
MTDTDSSSSPDVADKARERVTLSRGELWLLRVAAATGVFSLLSHGGEFVGWLLGL